MVHTVIGSQLKVEINRTMFKTLVILLIALVGVSVTIRSVVKRSTGLRMGLDPVLAKNFPRDFAKIPFGTDYGSGSDEAMNKAVESRRMDYLEAELQNCLKEAVATKERVMFTTALITGDAVILDAIAKAVASSKRSLSCLWIHILYSLSPLPTSKRWRSTMVSRRRSMLPRAARIRRTTTASMAVITG